MVRSALGLLCLLLVAAGLRTRGNDCLLPLEVEPDAAIPVQVILMEERAPNPERDRNYGSYPHLVALATRALTDPAPPVPPASRASLEAQLAAAGDPVLRVRRVVGWLSLLSLLGTWIIARRFVGPRWALLATAFAATSLLATHFSAQARPHAAAMSFSTLAVAGCLHLAARGGWRDYLLTGVLCGLAIGTLQSGIALGFPFLVAHLIAARQRGLPARLAGGRRAALALIPLATLGLCLLAFYPFLFASSAGRDGAQLELDPDVIQQSGHRLFLHLFAGRGFGKLGRALWSWEPMLCLGAALGLAVWIFTRRGPRPARGASEAGARPRGAMASVVGSRGDLAVVLAYVLPYLAVCGMYERVYERFLLPMIPFFSILAAWGLQRLHLGGAARDGRLARLLAPSLAVLLLLPAGLIAWRLTAIRVAPNTMQLAAGWLEQHADAAGSRVLLTPPLRLPFFSAEPEGPAARRPLGSVYQRLNWSGYQHRVFGPERPAPTWDLVTLSLEEPGRPGVLTNDPRTVLGRQSGDFLVAEVFDQGRRAAVLTLVHLLARRQGELLARFSPDGAGGFSEHPLSYQDTTSVPPPHMAWRVLRAERMGPVLEIFRPGR